MPGSYESVESPLRVGAIGNGSGSEPCAWYGFHHSDARNLVGDDGGRGGVGAELCVKYELGTGKHRTGGTLASRAALNQVAQVSSRTSSHRCHGE